MARKRSAASVDVGTLGFYKWKGEAAPAIVVAVIPDSPKGEVSLNVFTRNGVMVVQRAAQGNGDAEFSTSAEPAVNVVDDEPESE